jgi:hypothetical protein
MDNPMTRLKFIFLTNLGYYHVYAESKRKAQLLIPTGVKVLKGWNDASYNGGENPVAVIS